MPHRHADHRTPAELMVHCQGCNLPLAGWVAGLLVIRRDRTEIIAERVHSIRCHRCGAPNAIMPISPLPAVVSSEYHYSLSTQVS